MTHNVAERVGAEIGTRGLIIGKGLARQAFNELGHVETPREFLNRWPN
jgi:hypothetical protein